MHRWALVGRAWLFAAFSTAVALLGHLLAGGALTSVMAPLATVLVGSAVALPLTRLRPSLLRTAALLLPAQALYHFVFGGMGHAAAAMPGADASGQASDSAGASGGAHDMSGMHDMASMHGHHGAPVPMPSFAPEPVGTAADLAAAASAQQTMLLAHLVAALLSIAAARWGEVLLSKVATWLRLAFTRALRLISPATPPPAVRSERRAAPQPAPAHPAFATSCLRFRGPPARA